VISRSYANILRLQRAGYCGDYITVAAQDPSRRQVVTLSKVFANLIFELCRRFRRTFSRESLVNVNIADGLEQVAFEERYESLNDGCKSILSEMGLQSHDLLGSEHQMAGWRTTVQAIDLAIVSYVGTHIKPFARALDLQNDQGQEYFQMPAPLLPYNSNTHALPKASQIFLRRRRLMCLDPFLGGREIWVFQQGDDMSDQRMYLSAGVEELTDLWGPCWRLYRGSEPEQIQSIEIGNGCLLPWSTSGLTDDVPEAPEAPEATGSEVHCH
jgi:hypothetical protein